MCLAVETGASVGPRWYQPATFYSQTQTLGGDARADTSDTLGGWDCDGEEEELDADAKDGKVMQYQCQVGGEQVVNFLPRDPKRDALV